MKKPVVCDFEMNLDASRCLKFALWFAGAMRQHLNIRMPAGEKHDALAKAIYERYGVDLTRSNVRLVDGQAVRENALDCIYVSPLPLNEARRIAPFGSDLLLSLQEDGGRQSQGVRPICLPFGSRDMEMRAADLAFPIAKQLGTHVVAVHTTYPKPGMSDKRPLAHLVESTRKAMVELEARAAKHQVALQFDIQMAEEIACYVIEAAIHHSCGLLVMSRGRVLHGCNAERVAERTHLPILLTGGGS